MSNLTRLDEQKPDGLAFCLTTWLLLGSCHNGICDLATAQERRFVNSNPNLGISIVLNIIGIMLVLTAILILLKGLGLLATLPNEVIWAIVLFSIGVGILGGIRTNRSR